eukprot:SM000262S09883  [mRNA]  locus=s262:43074:46242:- [translate_table: standard]
MAAAPPPAAPLLIDSHLHVWAGPGEPVLTSVHVVQAEDFPYYPGQEPTVLGSVQHLLDGMRAAGIDGALIVQPINHRFDHSYVSSVLQLYPGKFVGCCLADPTEGGGGLEEMTRLLTQGGFRAVRFNPYLWPSGQKMTNEVGRAMFRRAGELGAPVGFMCFKGLLLHLEEIEILCATYPYTNVMIDHFGFCKPPLENGEGREAWTALLSLSRFPRVFVKVSAFFRVSREGYPYRDTWPLVQELVITFGAQRLLWGSDFPYVTEECSYSASWQILPSEKDIQEELMSRQDAALVLGGSARLLFPGAWAN